jgi:hypothetical protein
MGNLYAESSMNPFCVTGSKAKNTTGQLYTGDVDALVISKDEFIHDGVAYGLVQWLYYSRKEGLYNYAKQNNLSIGSIEAQIGFLLKEVKTYKTVWEALTSADNIRKASDIFMLKYEKPANTTDSAKEKRSNFAHEYFNKFHDVVYTAPINSKTVKVVTTANRVFVRTGNGKEYLKVERIEKKGTEFEWIATAENGWHAIKYDNMYVYWISGDYSELVIK